MTKRYAVQPDESLIRVDERTTVSRVAPYRIQAARNHAWYFGTMVAGLMIALLSLLSLVADFGNKTVLIIIFCIAFTALAVGAAGMVAFGRVLDSLLDAQETINISERKDPAGGDTIKTFSIPTGTHKNTIKVGPVHFTKQQWRIIAEASSKNGWAWSRGQIEKSDANVSNLNRKYQALLAWMLGDELVYNSTPEARNPKYYLTERGTQFVEQQCE